MSQMSRKATCPFDAAHVVDSHRLQHHILKCKRNLPIDHEYVQCQFSSLHYVKQGQLEEHYKRCEHVLARQAEKRTARSPIAELIEQDQITEQLSSYETGTVVSWDDIPNETTPLSDREEVVQDLSPCMIIPPGLSKAKRKEFRDEERKRLARVSNCEGKNSGNPSRSSDSFEEPRKPKLNLNPSY